MVKMACERLLRAFMLVEAVARQRDPCMTRGMTFIRLSHDSIQHTVRDDGSDIDTRCMHGINTHTPLTPYCQVLRMQH